MPLFSTVSITFIWIVYVFLCIPCVYLMLTILPKKHNQTGKTNFIFFYLLSVSIFLLGVVVAFTLAITLFFIKPPKKKLIILTADYPDYQGPPQIQFNQYGEGYGFKLSTKSTHNSKAMRQKALVALNQFSTAEVNKINISLLTDNVDEMRLYAQSLIEKQEREITSFIKYCTQELEKPLDEKTAAYYKKQIAEVLWEKIYKYLVNNESLSVMLNKIRNCALEALAVLPHDMELPVLLARLALKEQDLPEAIKWLEKAQKNEVPTYKIVFYLAEISFIEKNYEEVRKLLNKNSYPGIIGLRSIQSFWANV